MRGAPYTALLLAHAVILCALAVMASFSPRRSWFAIALAAVLYNAVPLSPVSGVRTALFPHDLAFPLLLLLVLRRPAIADRRLLGLVAAAALLWPAIGAGFGLIGTAEYGETVQFLFRRLGFVVLFAAGLSGVLERGRLRTFLDACLLIWVGMAIAGLLQFTGLIDTDVGSVTEEEFRGRSIFETIAAARGFMGLNRGAVGVWGSAAVGYAFAMLAALEGASLLQLGAYAGAGAASLAVLFLSGSRTGLVAALAGVAFTVARLVLAGKPARVLRIGAVGAALALGAGAAVAALDVGDLISARFALEAGTAETGQQRAAIQRATVEYVLEDPRALAIGMGYSVPEFRRHVGSTYDLSHAHSEYVEVFWHAGAVGLALYLALLWALFRRLRPSPGAPPEVFAGRSILVAGLVAGLAVGNIFVMTTRLAPFSLLMAFVYGALVNEASPRPVPEPAPDGGRPRPPLRDGPNEWSCPC